MCPLFILSSNALTYGVTIIDNDIETALRQVNNGERRYVCAFGQHEYCMLRLNYKIFVSEQCIE